MSCSLSILTAGRNATGLSAMFSVERELQSSTDSLVLSRCLINVGDTAQRFCSENRIKLSRVSCLIITSLAPHNVSGLPGLLLCLSSLVMQCLKLQEIARDVIFPQHVLLTTHFHSKGCRLADSHRTSWASRTHRQYGSFYEQKISRTQYY